jgi:FlaA1/EpsC-like NDP-sugar epimerase
MRRWSPRGFVRLLQTGIAAILLAGVWTRNISVAVNAGLGLAVTFVPAVLKRDYRLHLSPGMSVFVAVAVFLHTVGMLGFYTTVWWYDHLTHAFSASLVAAAGYATARAVDAHRDDLQFPRQFLAVFILLLTLALGVLWEVAEWVAREAALALALDPVLVVYGVEDSLLDLVFDAVGAVAVATLGTRYLAGDIAAVQAWLSDD